MEAPDLGKLTQTLCSQVTESENGHLDFQFDSSVSGTKDIQNYNKPIDFFYFIHHIYGIWKENTYKYAKKWKNVILKSKKGFMVID